MVQNNSDEDDEVNRLTESFGLPYQVRISQGLSELLKPNEFLSGLGIQYLERIKIILGSLKEHLIPNKGTLEDVMPKEGVIIPLAMAKGPFIKEELISIHAKLSDDNGETVILFTADHEDN